MCAGEIILWVGPKHSGKTTAATGLVKNLRAGGYDVGGILAPSLYQDRRLVGFDVVDLFSNRRAPLLRPGQPADVGAFVFMHEGLLLGQSALGSSTRRRCDLVIIDEFGPLELAGRGWRDAVDSLVADSDFPLLLVVREHLQTAVSELYASSCPQVLGALGPDSTAHVEQLLSKRRRRTSPET